MAPLLNIVQGESPSRLLKKRGLGRGSDPMRYLEREVRMGKV